MRKRKGVAAEGKGVGRQGRIQGHMKDSHGNNH